VVFKPAWLSKFDHKEGNGSRSLRWKKETKSLKLLTGKIGARGKERRLVSQNMGRPKGSGKKQGAFRNEATRKTAPGENSDPPSKKSPPDRY